jgi:hypothetical protein
LIERAELWPAQYLSATDGLAEMVVAPGPLEFTVREATRRRLFELHGSPPVSNNAVMRAERSLAELSAAESGVPGDRVELAETYADRFARDHRLLNDGFFHRLDRCFSATEIAQLAYLVHWFDSVYGMAAFTQL